jgi:hypothetical protein
MLARKDLPRTPALARVVPAIDRIQHVLARAASPGTFASRHTAGTDDISFDVVGVGAVPLPLSHRTADKLRAIAKPARYGLREKTLIDPRVRDTWEIGKRQIKLDERHWQRTLDRELPLIARDLGVPQGATLRADLHNLLVYEPGQFFAPHQDSEKADGMIGSLVVLLPSDVKGGALVIEHHREKVSYRGSPNQIVLVAFYADCRHEVRPVTSGYRAALTFNLLLDAADHRNARPTTKAADALVDLVREYFATPRPEQRPFRSFEPAPERLVYLLDHEYTQKGLSWQALKNGDALRAALLRNVAERLDCEIVLALADVHETWSCEDDWKHGEYGYGRRRRGWHARDDENDADEDDSDEDYTLVDLCDSDVELRHWVSPSNKRVQAISGEVLSDEICFTKSSVDLAPFKSEHEGYTGNAGNTVDRWYHRAAVLIWPRTRTFAIRAKASPAWGIREIAKALARQGRRRSATHRRATPVLEQRRTSRAGTRSRGSGIARGERCRGRRARDRPRRSAQDRTGDAEAGVEMARPGRALWARVVQAGARALDRPRRALRGPEVPLDVAGHATGAAQRTSSSSIGRSPSTGVPTFMERSRATSSRSPTSLGALAAPIRSC